VVLDCHAVAAVILTTSNSMASDAAQMLQAFVDSIGHVARMLLLKPVREMSEQEAFNAFLTLVSEDKIALQDPIRTDRAGKIISPSPGQQVRVKTSMAGVEFRQAIGNNKGPFGSVGAQAAPFFEPTPAFAIVLYRLADWLKSTWDASSIVWGGIGHGSGAQETDCHMRGHCVDFYGANTSGGVFDVRRDWYRRPVFLANYARPQQVDDDYWGTTTQTNYRLMRTKDVEERDGGDPQYWNPRARDFFLDVFAFIEEQCNHGDIGAIAMRSGGAFKGGWTVHPDYPTYERRPHNDHIHFQLGKTFE
jgi:hypothetical protein